MDMKRHLKSALKQLGFDKPRKAQIIPMNTLDAEQDAIIIAATGSVTTIHLGKKAVGF